MPLIDAISWGIRPAVPAKKKRAFLQEEKQSKRNERPLAKFCGIVKFPRRILRFFFFCVKCLASLGSTLRGQSSFLIFEHEETDMSIDWRAGIGWRDYRLWKRRVRKVPWEKV